MPASPFTCVGFPPSIDEGCTHIILGSMPGAASLKAQQYYAYPQNRFWRMLAAVYGAEVPGSIEEKRALLLSNGLALWDVLERCEIRGSSDASIRGAVPVKIETVTGAAKIRRVLVNGTTAAKYYARYLEPKTGIAAVCLPSTSPANAAYRLERLTALWGAALLGEEG